MIKKLLYTVVFILSMILVIKGRSINGYMGLSVMMVGLIGILSELYLYNKRYQ